MSTAAFDIKKLYPVLTNEGWTEGRKLMEFWVQGKAQIAALDDRGKATIGANVLSGLRIYTLQWPWLQQSPPAVRQYQKLRHNKVLNSAVVKEIIKSYGDISDNIATSTFNGWIKDGLPPQSYLGHHTPHQKQYIAVEPYSLLGGMDDMVAALNNFSYFVFYKGYVVNAQKVREQKTRGINTIIQDPNVEKHIANNQVERIIRVTNIGVYAGDVYEFGGHQYLGTWDIINNTASRGAIDIMRGDPDTEDEDDLSITNATFREYRKATGKGGDFLALSPLKVEPLHIVIPIDKDNKLIY